MSNIQQTALEVIWKAMGLNGTSKGIMQALTAAGFAIVPIKPTEEMLVSGQDAWFHERTKRNAIEDCHEANIVFRAMVSTAQGD